MRGTPPAMRPMEKRRRAAKLGGSLPPATHLPAEGGYVHRKSKGWGRVLGSPPGKGPSAGATYAGEPFPIYELSLANQPCPRGTATKRDWSPERTRIRTLFFLSERALASASLTSPGVLTGLPATSRMTSPSLKPRSLAAPFGSTPVT